MHRLTHSHKLHNHLQHDSIHFIHLEVYGANFTFTLSLQFLWHKTRTKFINRKPLNGFRTISMRINSLCMIANTVFLVFMVSRDTFQTYVRSERCNCSYVYALLSNINVWHISIVKKLSVLHSYFADSKPILLEKRDTPTIRTKLYEPITYIFERLSLPS